jgi:hypothetical protein
MSGGSELTRLGRLGERERRSGAVILQAGVREHAIGGVPCASSNMLWLTAWKPASVTNWNLYPHAAELAWEAGDRAARHQG